MVSNPFLHSFQTSSKEKTVMASVDTLFFIPAAEALQRCSRCREDTTNLSRGASESHLKPLIDSSNHAIQKWPEQESASEFLGLTSGAEIHPKLSCENEPGIAAGQSHDFQTSATTPQRHTASACVSNQG